MASHVNSGRFLRAFLLCALVFAVLALAGCADWKLVRKSHLVNLADGIEYVVTRVEPRVDLPAEEQDKVKRVAAKVLRNARALAEVKSEAERVEGEVQEPVRE